MGFGKWLYRIMPLFLLLLAISCAGTTYSQFTTEELAQVGKYSPVPEGLRRPKLAVLDFIDNAQGSDTDNKHSTQAATRPVRNSKIVTTTEHSGKSNRAQALADQMTTLWLKSGRFQMIERQRLKDLFREQTLIVVSPQQRMRVGRVLGADLLCYGSITSFEVQRNSSSFGKGLLPMIGAIVSIAAIAAGEPEYALIGLGLQALDFNYQKDQLDIHLGLDVYLVDTTSGEILLAESADVKRTDTAKRMGLAIIGIDVNSQGQIFLDSANQGRLSRFALDTVIRKMLPKIDSMYGNVPVAVTGEY